MSRIHFDFFLFHSDEVVITFWFHGHVQQNDWDRHIPNGISKEQEVEQEAIRLNSSTTVKRIVQGSYE